MRSEPPVAPGPSVPLTRYAWAFVGYLVAVILFGAWVRITGSGAGCGNHWPVCNGEVVPLTGSTQEIIEYTHRVTSGLCGVFVLALVGWAWRRFRGGRVFRAACVTLLFVLVEGAIGALLVKQELVANDDSVARAVVVGVHLVNTLFLVASAALAAWWSSGRPAFRWQGRWRWPLLVALVALLLTSATGAVTALGDTLFPVDPGAGEGLLGRVRDDLGAANHFLVRLRIVHPLVAVASAFYLLWLGTAAVRDGATAEGRRLGHLLRAVVVAQVLIGFVNIGLAAPGWAQLVHLLAANVVWLLVVLVGAALLAEPDAAQRPKVLAA